MDLTRRQFGILLGISPAALSPAMAAASRDRIVERRVYESAGAAPPASVLRRCGITVVRYEETPAHVELVMHFPSLEERVRGWDGFNSDPEWCALREGREVRLVGMAIDAASRTTS
jgi:hypothetical protein